MKKFFAILLALVCLLAMTACGETAPEETLPPEQMPGSSLEILEKIWAGIPEDKRQPVFGGDSSNVLENVPGAYDLADDGAVYTLLIPEAELGKLDGAAAMVHALMRNVFTCSAVHVAEGNSGKEFAESMYKSVTEHEFDCGAPEQVMVATLGGEYVVTCYGTEACITDFVTAMKEAYPAVQVVYQEYWG